MHIACVDSIKDCFNLTKNEKFYYEEQELLCHLEPPYPANNSQMTLAFLTVTLKVLWLL